MKNPWFAFTGICALVLGIVLFCVVFGGYSSLLRSQNRIEAATRLLADQCTQQVTMVTQLVDSSGQVMAEEEIQALKKEIKALESVLNRMSTTEGPMAADLLASFASIQSRLGDRTQALVTSIKASADLAPEKLAEIEQKALESRTGVFIMAKRYNKEARYFNNRTQVFPGVLIARLFSLDQITFPEIAAAPLAPEETAQETSSAT